MFAALCYYPRRSLLFLTAAFLVTAGGCGETDVPTASISGPIVATNASPGGAEQLLGGWIAGGDFSSQGDDIASQMQQGIAQESCRFEFKTDHQVDIILGSTAPVQTGQWQVLGSRGQVLSIQIVAPEFSGSTEPCRFDIVFHDQDHLTMRQAEDDGLSFLCTRLR